jgi:GT2 family glycosyltransferase
MGVNLCVPVLKRYDLLRNLLMSLHQSTVKLERVIVIDNGRDKERLKSALVMCPTHHWVETPDKPMGVAESWNWFLQYVGEERIITNDDVLFASDSIEKIIACKSDLVWASGFSCFLIRDACVAKIGLFDETISPGYGYYEDEDYLQRLDGRGTLPRAASAENVDAGVVHLKSQTLQAASHEEILEHHRRFKIAQGNYIKKWNLQESFR